MREAHIRRLMEASHPVIVHVPAYRRKELEKEGTIVSEWIDAKVIEMGTLPGTRKHCSVVVRDGMGRDIKLLARSIIKLKGRGDDNKDRFRVRPVKRKRPKRPKREQMSLFA